MLVTSIFSFSHYAFKNLFPDGHQKSLLYGEGLIPGFFMPPL